MNRSIQTEYNERQEEGDQRLIKLRQLGKLDISVLENSECVFLFRFTYAQIQSMVVILELGEKVYFRENTPQQYSLPTKDALSILFRRMTYHARLKDLSIVFGRSESTISEVFNGMINKLVQKFGPALLFDYRQFRKENLVCFSQAIRRAGAPVEHCVGFIDCTFIRTARPRKFQQSVYSGHYRGHGLRYQAVVTPDEDIMKETFDIRGEGGPCYHLYGDKAYASSLYMMRPFKRYSPNPDHKDVNTAMPSLQRIFLRPAGSYYLVATFLKNLHNCFNRRNQTSKRFGVAPPTPTEYIDGLLGNT
ncbi:hypothetical protein PHYBLDRAFT_145446 [Phycomyces blakesleeanus NRRL 1555(-)]|uniref:DDE Tnp4 domain-containing protein n=1 Tax=Phycomyces blakesleeanus (strain ATCC 8743b / DSM 1359 / FGSC 10004 / NBRC 33097 / NRRL 1555) TaxID=763407 RepID=A0A162U731_PHYB8|nr:hypothetical protein PHYBLDRAFT_145446 [Phycomyces blakesleeanus NRRL 1555(-)]OAD73982.1 hypothetical protein PHYBLDRAFT_145446 [Phycomyces blakesleeanus NRRL 1555(-)]|eukprot:XP_018292022.1 hypothetical protein PHYBLDRAFT_145446 [Phycomyces blakesleeanus NRRL 1555(-)]